MDTNASNLNGDKPPSRDSHVSSMDDIALVAMLEATEAMVVAAEAAEATKEFDRIMSIIKNVEEATQQFAIAIRNSGAQTKGCGAQTKGSDDETAHADPEEVEGPTSIGPGAILYNEQDKQKARKWTNELALMSHEWAEDLLRNAQEVKKIRAKDSGSSAPPERAPLTVRPRYKKSIRFPGGPRLGEPSRR